jgi:nicotinamidase/pyrazinamidase
MSSSSSSASAGDYVLLIIDPQRDFHEGGALAVVGYPGATGTGAQLGGEGATKDSEAIIALIKAKKPTAVYVSLDTHTPTHIGHQAFWTPQPPLGVTFNVVTIPASEDVAEHEAVVYSAQGSNIEVKPASTGDAATDAALAEWVITYVKTLVTAGKFTPCIWPNHCLEGSEGHKLHPGLKAALDELDVPVEYHIKGQNEATEMYSIFQAEYPVEGRAAVEGKPALPAAPEAVRNLYRGIRPVKEGSKIATAKSDVEDHANLKTDFNDSLYASLMSHGKPIVVCGEALSHCVNWSTQDLNEKRKGEGNTTKIYLLTNASSVVNLETINFPADIYVKQTKELFEYCESNGVTLTTTDAILSGGLSGGRRRRKNRKTKKRQAKKRQTRRR